MHLWQVLVKWHESQGQFVNLVMRLREDGTRSRRYHIAWDRATRRMVNNSDWRIIRGWDGAEGEATEVAERVAVAMDYLKEWEARMAPIWAEENDKGPEPLSNYLPST